MLKFLNLLCFNSFPNCFFKAPQILSASSTTKELVCVMQFVDTAYRCRRVQACYSHSHCCGSNHRISPPRLTPVVTRVAGAPCGPACAERWSRAGPNPVLSMGLRPALLQLLEPVGSSGSAVAVCIHTSLRSLPGDVMLVLQEHMLSIFCRVTVFFLVFIRIYLT